MIYIKQYDHHKVVKYSIKSRIPGTMDVLTENPLASLETAGEDLQEYIWRRTVAKIGWNDGIAG